MAPRTGNQTGYELENDPESLYNPGFADSGRAESRSADPDLDVYSEQDLSVPAKVTLGSYLSAVTSGKAGNSRPNSFYIDGGSNDTQGTGHIVSKNASNKTFPSYARSQIESAGATIGSYMDLAKSYDPNMSSRFESTKDSQYAGDVNPFVNTEIKRPDSPSRRKGLDGNSLLTNVRSTPGTVTGGAPGDPKISDVPENTPVVQKKISEVLRSNRFSPVTRAFVQNHTRQVPGGFSIQRQMGAYDESQAAVNEARLKEIGQLLMVRATGHGTSLDVADRNRISTLSNTVPFYPSAAQFSGLPVIDTVNLMAGSLPLKDTEGRSQEPRAEYLNQEGPDFDPEYSLFTGKTYGVLNSHLEPFGGAFPIGTLTTAIGNILAVAVFSVGIGYIIQALGARGIENEENVSKHSESPWKLDLGRYGLNDESEIAIFFKNLLGIPNIKHAFGDAVLAGFLSFLGMGNNGNDRTEEAGFAGISGDSILRGAVNLFFAPGYYASVLRNAIRDVQQVVQSITDIGAAGDSGQVLAAIAGVFKMIESITTSAIYRFLMSMAALGDRVLDAQETTREMYIANESKNSRMRNSRIDDSADASSFDYDIGAPKGQYPLSWKHSGTRSLYILPSSFLTAKKSFLGQDTSLAINRAAEQVSGGGRISSDKVKEIERTLESEYVPFYFHDLRTNEIISFHAFLTSLSDGFTATYTNTAGYGRTDEVMTYSNTKRSISVDFSVVATSKADMDVLYWNINKLVSMLYPQFSRGRTMENGSQKFIQPFSQIPTASPMIRLRIGDIVKSNYSKFALARLFGIGLGDQVFNPNVTAPPSANSTESARADGERQAQAQIQGYEVNGYEVDLDVKLKIGNYKFTDSLGTVPRRPVRGVPTNLFRSEPIGKVISVSTIQPARGSRSRQQAAPANPAANKEYVIKLSTDIVRSINLTATSPLPEQHQYVKVPHSSISGLTAEERREIINQKVGAAVQSATANSSTAGAPPPGEDETKRATAKFFSEENNPIVRSFNSTMGRGLAGFITDFKTDWNDSTWEIDSGMVAPKFMKISISFSPIHDIPLGLDHDGMMKSVAYNVGSISREVGSSPYDEIYTPPEAPTQSNVTPQEVVSNEPSSTTGINIPGANALA